MHAKEIFEKDQMIYLHRDIDYDAICDTETLEASEMTKREELIAKWWHFTSLELHGLITMICRACMRISTSHVKRT